MYAILSRQAERNTSATSAPPITCSPRRIRDTELKSIVLTAMQRYIREVTDLDAPLSMTDAAPLRTAEAQKAQRQLDRKRAELER